MLGCTSKSEEKPVCRPGTGKEGVHRCDPVGGGEPVGLTQKADANGSTPLRCPNCVHYVSAPVGEHLKYLVSVQGQAIACLAWSSAPRHLGCRDRFIGWNPEQRRRNVHLLAYNTRFLILPWVRVPHLASYLLGRMAGRIARDWQQCYAHPVWLLETFVDPSRFRGTCYRAANWLALGYTTGRGKDDREHLRNRPVKQVLVYPLHRRFRERLTA